MPQIVQDWLGTRLGIVTDLSADKFGQNTKDGRLLAKLLHSYGLVSPHLLQRLKPAKYAEDCLNNLYLVKPSLDYIGVPTDSSILKEIASGQGSAALRLFYSLYLNLERRDKLHFLSAQKEKKFNDAKGKIKLDWVPEMEVGPLKPNFDSNLAFSLVEKQYLVNWHAKKCSSIIDKINETHEKFAKTTSKAKPGITVMSKTPTCQQTPEWTRKHARPYGVAITPENLDKYHLYVEDLHRQCKYPSFFDLYPEAGDFVNALKLKTQKKTITKTFQQKMQNLLLDDLWKKVIESQESNFYQKVSRYTINQSQYEKQISSKLLLIKHQKQVLAENQKLIEKLIMNLKDREFDDALNQQIEANENRSENELIEKEKLKELHKRLFSEKVRQRYEQNVKEARSILDSMIDIAIRCADYRAVNGCQVPNYLIKDMKELFLKNLPIFDILEEVEDLYDEELLNDSDDEEFEYIRSVEFERQEVLDACDMNDYLHLLGPWMSELLWDYPEEEVYHVVLGYLVHKLLLLKYPMPEAPNPADIKPMHPTAVVQGLSDEKASGMLLDLLATRKILLVTVRDAINHVLQVYKSELSVVRDIDITFQKATKGAMKGKKKSPKGSPTKKEAVAGRGKGKKKSPSPKVEEPFKEVETQTPRKIPDDDPLLTPNAELGKIAFESSGLGSPVPDYVIVLAIASYVASKEDDYNGWVLLNYPLMYTQAQYLESHLTGYELMPSIEDLDTIEEIIGYKNRISGTDPKAIDHNFLKRNSQLVPNVSPPKEYPEAKTYFRAFIQMKKSETNKPAEERLSLPPLENYYFQQGILYSFEYLAFNFQSMKELAKLILGEISGNDEIKDAVSPKTSVEIFGDTYLKIAEKWAPSKKKKSPQKSKKRSPTIKNDLTSKPVETPPKPEPDEPTRDLEKSSKSQTPMAPIKPGDKDWVWADAPQPPELVIAMATFWENLETIYVEDFKKIFFCLRVHHSRIILFSTFVKKFMRNFLRRPDDKPRLLSEFQHMFNAINVDLRPDIDIKCELHTRVAEFEASLLAIADERKKKSEAQRVRVIRENWVSDEMTSLINFYLMALQLEVDRCVDSCQLINDYYNTLQQKLPDESVLQKPLVPRLQVKDREYLQSPSLLSARSEGSHASAVDPNNSKQKEEGGEGDPPQRSFLHMACDALCDVLIDLNLPEDGFTLLHTYFNQTVDAISGQISSMLGNMINNTKKGDKGAKGADPKADVGAQIAAEWPKALQDELSRFLFRCKLIRRRGIMDIDEFLMAMMNTYLVLSDEIGQIFAKEVQNISECCKLFRSAIEEETAIQPQLQFNVDDFVVCHGIKLFPDSPPPSEPIYDEKPSESSFMIDQLSNLHRKLRRVAPNGEIIRRAFIYILEDLRAMKAEDGKCRHLPLMWDKMKPDEMATLFDEIYQKLEIVNWKDFIVYALELPFPTENEILTMRERFRDYDRHSTELICREDYNQIEFWFDDDIEDCQDLCRRQKAKDLLFEMFQVDENNTNYSAMLLAFCKDIDPAVGFLKAIALSVGKRIKVRDSTEPEVEVSHEEAEITVQEIVEEIISDAVQEAIGCIVTNLPCSAELTLEEEEGPDYAHCPPPRKKDCSCKKESRSTARSFLFRGEESGEAGESLSVFYPSEMSMQSSVMSATPSDVVTSVVLTSFPSLPQLALLLNCPNTLRDTLQAVYESLEPVHDTVQTYKLLQHDFMYHLLTSTNKFRSVHIASIVRDMLEPNMSEEKPEVVGYVQVPINLKKRFSGNRSY